MKVLSVVQPWATLLITGEKKIETRGWETSHRGPLLIHSSKKWNPSLADLCTQEPYLEALSDHGFWPGDGLPLGHIIGAVFVEDCQPIEQLLAVLSETEKAFGDYGPQRWGWLCSRPIRFQHPIQARGNLGLWEFRDQLLSEHLTHDEAIHLSLMLTEVNPVS
jgi:activating signal cointegrator 1